MIFRNQDAFIRENKSCRRFWGLWKAYGKKEVICQITTDIASISCCSLRSTLIFLRLNFFLGENFTAEKRLICNRTKLSRLDIFNRQICLRGQFSKNIFFPPRIIKIVLLEPLIWTLTFDQNFSGSPSGTIFRKNVLLKQFFAEFSGYRDVHLERLDYRPFWDE